MNWVVESGGWSSIHHHPAFQGVCLAVSETPSRRSQDHASQPLVCASQDCAENISSSSIWGTLEKIFPTCGRRQGWSQSDFLRRAKSSLVDRWHIIWIQNPVTNLKILARNLLAESVTEKCDSPSHVRTDAQTSIFVTPLPPAITVHRKADAFLWTPNPLPASRKPSICLAQVFQRPI